MPFLPPSCRRAEASWKRFHIPSGTKPWRTTKDDMNHGYRNEVPYCAHCNRGSLVSHTKGITMATSILTVLTWVLVQSSTAPGIVASENDNVAVQFYKKAPSPDCSCKWTELSSRLGRNNRGRTRNPEKFSGKKNPVVPSPAHAPCTAWTMNLVVKSPNEFCPDGTASAGKWRSGETSLFRRRLRHGFTYLSRSGTCFGQHGLTRSTATPTGMTLWNRSPSRTLPGSTAHHLSTKKTPC